MTNDVITNEFGLDATIVEPGNDFGKLVVDLIKERTGRDVQIYLAIAPIGGGYVNAVTNMEFDDVKSLLGHQIVSMISGAMDVEAINPGQTVQ